MLSNLSFDGIEKNKRNCKKIDDILRKQIEMEV
jgi:hypothetical protein